MAFTLWFTGLSGSGKTTLSSRIHAKLQERGLKSELFDGDVIRTYISQGLGFSRQDRIFNVKRVGFSCSLLNKHGVNCVVAMIAPYQEARGAIRKLLPDYVEVFCDSPLEVCEARDVKGLYKRARAGEISNFTGISDPYDIPSAPEIRADTAGASIEDCLDRIMSYLEGRGLA